MLKSSSNVKYLPPKVIFACGLEKIEMVKGRQMYRFCGPSIHNFVAVRNAVALKFLVYGWLF